MKKQDIKYNQVHVAERKEGTTNFNLTKHFEIHKLY